MRCLISIFVVFMVLAANSVAQERISGFRPSSEPDRIILTITGDPSTTMAVTWRTDTTVSASEAQISPDYPTIFISDSSSTVKGSFIDVNGDGVIGRYHSVNFTGLVPGTAYAYRVGSGNHKSEWIRFKTAAAEPLPFSFIYLGDSQVYDDYLFARLIRQVYRAEPNSSFVLYGGDLVDGGVGVTLQDEEWGEWYKASSFIHREIPVVPTAGNHEYVVQGNRELRQLNRYWRPGFALPENGPEGLEETVYYMDYQGVRFISLNSYVLSGSDESAKIQADWLEKVLENNPNKWTVLFMHYPFYSTSKTRDNKREREYFKPIVDKYNVDLVLSGHDHTYARGFGPEAMKNLNKKAAGPVYVVSVSGAKQYKQDADKWWDIGSTYTQFYQVINVNKDILDYKAYDVSGNLFDHFLIKKKKDGRKLFFDDLQK
ncbi:MAG: metallophosphoesterase family protein [Bacteroidales bacterium]|nr:metallophosphoesterase family protein [Bacteroidales bacterium]